jgi:hypothetical protein
MGEGERRGFVGVSETVRGADQDVLAIVSCRIFVADVENVDGDGKGWMYARICDDARGWGGRDGSGGARASSMVLLRRRERSQAGRTRVPVGPHRPFIWLAKGPGRLTLSFRFRIPAVSHRLDSQAPAFPPASHRIRSPRVETDMPCALCYPS